MAEEIASLLDFVLDLLRDYGLDDFYLELSTKPEGKAVGTDEEWDEATEALRVAAHDKGLDLVMDAGGGAFYGPKISVQARDAIGRTWQMSTIQLDFQMPQRFDLHYVGADNERHRPMMIHRALFGSIERFFAVLLEHYAGAFPVWLAPVQATRAPGRRPSRRLRVPRRRPLEGPSATGSRCIDGVTAALGSAHPAGEDARRCPYVLVVGDDDVEHGTVGVNKRAVERPERDVTVDDVRRAARGRGRRRTSDAARTPVGRLAHDYVSGLTDDKVTDHEDACVLCRLVAADRRRSRRSCSSARRATITVMNLYPYGSGHLMVAPLRHVAELRRPRRRRDDRARARAASARCGRSAPRTPRRHQPRRQPRSGRGRRRSRASARARAAPLERRHQLHDLGGRGAGAAREPRRSAIEKLRAPGPTSSVGAPL